MNHSPERLYIADFTVPEGWYANAYLLAECMVTAGHVASANPTLLVPGKTEIGKLDFLRHPTRDIAVATFRQTPGGFLLVLDEKNLDKKKIKKERVVVRGFHGPDRNQFEIAARILGVDRKKRIIIESLSKTHTFQEGMSGSVAELDGSIVVGFLVAGVEGQKGAQAFFEPAWALLEYVAGLESV